MASASEDRKINIYINGREVENNMKSIRAEYRKAQNELNKMTIGTDEYVKKSQDLKKLKTYIDDHNKGLFGASKAWAQLKSVMIGVLGANLIQSGLQKLVSFIPNLINRVSDLSDVMADVQKTSGLTSEEVRDLNEELATFNTRTPRKELLALAVEGGRLGKNTVKDLSDFVKVADQIKVALGDDLGGNGEEAIRMVGKLTEQYQVGNQYQTQFGESMLKVGSAINEVSASGANQASYLIDYMKRLSGVSVQADITAAATIGYAAALDEAGQNVEVSGTTMSKVMVNMFKDTATYAEIAGLKTEEFTQLLAEDSNEAMLKFLEGLNGNNEGLGVMATKMEDLELDGARAITVLSALAANTDKVREKQEIANRAMEEGTSLTREFAVKNENVAGQWEKIQKAMASIFVSGPIMDGVEALVGWMYEFIDIPVSETLEKERISMRALELQIYDTNTPADQRVQIIEQLKKDYPSYLKYIDAETVSNETLQGILKQVNDELVNKIVLQRKQEKIDAQAEIVADNLEQKLEYEQKTREALVIVAEKYGVQLGTNYDLQKKSAEVLAGIDANNVGGIPTRERNQLAAALSGLRSFSNAVDEASEKINGLIQNKGEFEKSIKKELEGAGTAYEEYFNQRYAENKKEETVVVSNPELSEKEKATLEKKYAAFKKAQEAMQKKYFSQVDEEAELLPYTGEKNTLFMTLFGDDKTYEKEMDKLLQREQEKIRILQEMDEAASDNKHETALEKELQYYELLKVQATEFGLDTSKITEAIEAKNQEIRLQNLKEFAERFEFVYSNLRVVADAYFEYLNYKNQASLEADRKLTEEKIANVQKYVQQDILTQEEADQRIKQIKEQAAARESKIKRDQWIKEKNAKLIQVAMETAIAVIKAAPNLALQISAGITGAASAAVIASQPIPQFAFGTDNAPGGQALVGEYGPEIVNLPKGSQVVSATETQDIMSDANNPRLNLGDTTGMNAALAVQNRLLEQIAGRLYEMPHLVKGDWRLDEFDRANTRRSRSESAGRL